MPAAQREKFLGVSKEMNAAYRWLTRDRELIRQRIEGTEAAMADSESFARSVEARAMDPTTEAGRLRREQVQAQRARNIREIRQERVMAEGGFRRQAVIELERARMDERGRGPIERFIGRGFMTQMAETGMGPSVISAAGRIGSLGARPIYDPAGTAQELFDIFSNFQNLGDVSDKLDAAAESLLRASEAQQTGTMQSARGPTE
jgi:hypothetical protein